MCTFRVTNFLTPTHTCLRHMNVSIDARKYDITTCYNTLSTNAQTHPTRKHIALTFERISTPNHADLSTTQALGVTLYTYYNMVKLFKLMEQNICTIPIRRMLENLPQPHVFDTLNTNTHAHSAKELIIIHAIA